MIRCSYWQFGECAMLKLPFYFVGDGDSLRKWLLWNYNDKVYAHIYYTPTIATSVWILSPYSSSVSESFVPTETRKQLVEEFRDTLNVDISMAEKICYLLFCIYIYMITYRFRRWKALPKYWYIYHYMCKILAGSSTMWYTVPW